jgi:hypothetical protein
MANGNLAFQVLFHDQRSSQDTTVSFTEMKGSQDTLNDVARELIKVEAASKDTPLSYFRFIRCGEFLNPEATLDKANVQNGDSLVVCAGPGTFPQSADRLRVHSLKYTRKGLPVPVSEPATRSSRSRSRSPVRRRSRSRSRSRPREQAEAAASSATTTAAVASGAVDSAPSWLKCENCGRNEDEDRGELGDEDEPYLRNHGMCKECYEECEDDEEDM